MSLGNVASVRISKHLSKAVDSSRILKMQLNNFLQLQQISNCEYTVSAVKIGANTKSSSGLIVRINAIYIAKTSKITELYANRTTNLFR
jgi:hypothetical protein